VPQRPANVQRHSVASADVLAVAALVFQPVFFARERARIGDAACWADAATLPRRTHNDEPDLAKRLALLALLAFASAGLLAQAPAPPRLTPLDASGRITYYVADIIPKFHTVPGDPELVRWATQEWETAAAGAFRLVASEDEGTSLIRIYWVSWTQAISGEARPIRSNGRITSTIFLRPGTAMMRKAFSDRVARDPLLRDVMVYHLALHEIGHALGLPHSAGAQDVMAAGISPERSMATYDRYRTMISTRDDIRRGGWLTQGDITALRQRYAGF
jgi:hypothetical protein